MPILNYTTSIDPAKTVASIQRALGRIGATRVSLDFRTDGIPTAVRFVADTDLGARSFRLEPNIAGVLEALKREHQRKAGKVTRGMLTKEHATRVAWRILHDKVQVITAEIEARITPVDEALFPFMASPNGLTTYQHYREQAALPAPARSPEP